MDRYHSELDQIVQKVRALAADQGKLSGFCIGNTRQLNESGLYFSPIRFTSDFVAGSVIVYEVDQAQWIAEQIDGKVDYILVDTEKKVSPSVDPNYGPGSMGLGNIEREVRDVIRVSRILTYKGNDLTVDSIEHQIVQLVSTPPRGLGAKKGAIIGAGNIGSKLALKLVERGMDITISRRDGHKLQTIVDALNMIKPIETVAAVRGTVDNFEAVRGADLLIGLTQGIPVITAAMIDTLNDGVFLLDAGKGCFFPDAVRRAQSRGLLIYRTDVRAGFEGHSAMALRTERLTQRSMGRSEVEGVPVASGGLLGSQNEVMVDDINHPCTIFGIANGMGDFVRSLDQSQTKAVKTIQAFIDQRQNP